MALRTDGLGREIVLSMVHDDGHVAALANQGTVEATVIQLHTLYSWMGGTGWAVQYLPVEDATYAFMRGQGCRRCALVFDCGCSSQRVMMRQCPHRSGDRLHALAHVVGYCTNDHPNHTGPPLPAIVRVYEAGARMGHLAPATPGAMLRASAVCGHDPQERWLGGVGDRQVATARRLPTCNACLRQVAQ